MLKLASLIWLSLISTFSFAANQDNHGQLTLLLAEVEKQFIQDDLPAHELKITTATAKASVQANVIYLNPEFASSLSAEALAFVFAHEVAHTSSFHSERMAWAAIFRHGFFRFLSGDTKGLFGSLTTDPKLLELSRKQEAEADKKAAQVLIKLGISPCMAFKEVILKVDRGIISEDIHLTHGSNRARLDAVCTFG